MKFIWDYLFGRRRGPAPAAKQPKRKEVNLRPSSRQSEEAQQENKPSVSMKSKQIAKAAKGGSHAQTARRHAQSPHANVIPVREANMCTRMSSWFSRPGALCRGSQVQDERLSFQSSGALMREAADLLEIKAQTQKKETFIQEVESTQASNQKPASNQEISEEALKRDRELSALQKVARKLLSKADDTISESLGSKILKKQASSSVSMVKGTWSNSSSDYEMEEEQSSLQEVSAEANMKQGFKNLICPLCLNFIYKCTITSCGHSFCERCLDEYLIVRKNCFMCDEAIRNKQVTQCFSIDNVIEQAVGRIKDIALQQKWERQKQTHKEWAEGKRLEAVEVGAKVDVRDTEYIWCEGTVKIKIECPDREPLLIVHYEGWNKFYDEIIKQNSHRVAPHGFYTSRKDLPRYSLKTENSMVGVIVNRVQPSITSQQPSKNQEAPKKDEQQVQGSAQQKEKTPQELRRESNAAIGDQIEEKLEEFFRTCEERQMIHSNQGNQSRQVGHPPVLYVRNQLSRLSEVYGGQNIYDSLLNNLSADNAAQNNQQPVAQNQPASGLPGGAFMIRRNIGGGAGGAAQPSGREGIVDSMNSIIDQIHRRFNLNNERFQIMRVGQRYGRIAQEQAAAGAGAPQNSVPISLSGGILSSSLLGENLQNPAQVQPVIQSNLVQPEAVSNQVPSGVSQQQAPPAENNPLLNEQNPNGNQQQ